MANEQWRECLMNEREVRLKTKPSSWHQYPKNVCKELKYSDVKCECDHVTFPENKKIIYFGSPGAGR
jgi:hypothetical protein